MTETKTERLIDRLKPLTAARLKAFTIGEVNQFEAMTSVDFDFFWRKMFPMTPKLDEHGFEMFDENGNPILVADQKALDNPQPIPNKTNCLATVVWLVNRDHIEGLTVPQLHDEVSYAELWGLLNQVPEDPDTLEVMPTIELPDGTPLTKTPARITEETGTAPESD